MKHRGKLTFSFEAITRRDDDEPDEIMEQVGRAVARVVNAKSPIDGIRVKLTPGGSRMAATIRRHAGYDWNALKRGASPEVAARTAGRARDSVFTREQPYGGDMIAPVLIPADDRGFDIEAELDEIARMVDEEAGSRWGSAIRRVKVD